MPPRKLLVSSLCLLLISRIRIVCHLDLGQEDLFPLFEEEEGIVELEVSMDSQGPEYVSRWK
jgi:hypothetical protein